MDFADYVAAAQAWAATLLARQETPDESETPASHVPAPPRTQTEAETYQRLRAHLAFLKLADATEALPRVLDEARASKLSLVDGLEQLLGVEVTATEDRRRTSRLRFACLPSPWRLSDLDYSAQPGVDEALIRELATLRFVDEGANVLFIGPPGVGKTMLAVGLARAGVEAGHRVYFTTAADLAARCRKAAIEGRWATMMRFYAGPRLLGHRLWRRPDRGRHARPLAAPWRGRRHRRTFVSAAFPPGPRRSAARRSRGEAPCQPMSPSTRRPTGAAAQSAGPGSPPTPRATPTRGATASAPAG